MPIGRTVRHQRLRVPDLLVAFGVDHAGVIYRHGYSIEEQDKPPDFVLEVASVTTGQNDYTQMRDDYAAFGVPEYWRFDPSGVEYHDAPLAEDHLVDGVYQPIEVVQFGDSSYRGHSAALGLDLCWEDGQLRWYDPASGRYLLTYDAALERVRELEDQVRRLQGRQQMVRSLPWPAAQGIGLSGPGVQRQLFLPVPSIILAGSPPVPDPAAGPLRCGSWGRRIPG